MKQNYHTKMAKVFSDKMAEMVEKDGALMDKVMFSSLRKSQRHHLKLAASYEAAVNELREKLTDIRLSMGTIR